MFLFIIKDNLRFFSEFFAQEFDILKASLCDIIDKTVRKKESIMARDYIKDELKTLDRIAKKIIDLEGHLVRIEDSLDGKKHFIAQHEAMKDMREILKKAKKVDSYEDEIIKHAGEGHKDSLANHTFYLEEEQHVVEDLELLFSELDDRLAKLTVAQASSVLAYEQRKDYVEKAKIILRKAGKYE